jgi:hypothetical protein
VAMRLFYEMLHGVTFSHKVVHPLRYHIVFVTVSL